MDNLQEYLDGSRQTQIFRLPTFEHVTVFKNAMGTSMGPSIFLTYTFDADIGPLGDLINEYYQQNDATVTNNSSSVRNVSSTSVKFNNVDKLKDFVGRLIHLYPPTTGGRMRRKSSKRSMRSRRSRKISRRYRKSRK
jgi:hypothetical protein